MGHDGDGKLTEGQVEFLREPNFGVLATVRPDGTPQETVVWVDSDGESLLFNTAEGRKKLDYLRRDPRASVLVIDRDDPWRWVALSGRVELTHEGAEEHIHKLGKKYRGWDRYPLEPGEQRVLATLRPERVNAYNVA